MQMTITMSKQGDTMVMEIDGQLVTSNRVEVKRLFLDAIERGERKFRIDLRHASYIDSSGLGVLVSVAKQTRQASGDLCLANLNPDLQHLFEVTKLDTLFRIDNRDGGEPAGRTAPLRPRGPRPRQQGTEQEPPRGDASAT
jgi:anti-anti-sigma factor